MYEPQAESSLSSFNTSRKQLSNCLLYRGTILVTDFCYSSAIVSWICYFFLAHKAKQNWKHPAILWLDFWLLDSVINSFFKHGSHLGILNCYVQICLYNVILYLKTTVFFLQLRCINSDCLTGFKKFLIYFW